MENELPPSVAGLARQLGELGVVPGALLMVHASLRRVGLTASDGALLIDALDRAVGSDGNVLMVLGAADAWAWVNARPEHERAALLADAEPFDALTTPAQPDVGTLAELFRRYPGTIVSDHPEGRFAARGRDAAALLAGQPWHDYYGPGSPLERLVECGGKILRLGADLDTVTVLHYAEYRVALPTKRRARRYRRVAGPHGPAIRVVDGLDDQHGIVDYPGEEDYFAALLREYLRTGRARTGQVGGARSELLDAADLIDYAVRWMATRLRG